MKEPGDQFRSEISKKSNQIMLLIFVLALVFVAVIASTGDGRTAEPSMADLSWNEGWLLPDGTPLSLPCAAKEYDSLTIRNTLPQGLTEQDRLVLSSGYQPVQVAVDGQRLPVTGTFEGRITYATAYSHAALSPEMSGKEVQVTFLNQGGKQWMELYSIKLGNAHLLRQAAFARDSVSVISSTVLLAISVLIFFVGLFQRKSAIQVLNNHTQNFVLASTVSVMFSIWMLVDTETITLMFGSNPAYVFVNIFSFLFIMGPWLMQIILSTGKHSAVLRILAMSGLLETAVIMLGVVLGFFNFSAYLTAAHLIGVGVEGAILFLSYDAFRQRRGTGSKLLFAASILMAVMSYVAAYTYYFAVSPNNVSYMKYGLFGYIVVMLYDLFITFESISRSYVSEVEAARQAAVEASRAKSDFLSSMSHDIRTPMNAIMGLTAIASSNIDSKEAVRDALHKITLSSRHLLGLINDILDMSKIESGKISLTVAELSLSELMDNLLSIIRPQSQSRHQTLEVVLENVFCEDVRCDGVRLNQILLNLLSNAVKYTQDEGSICVTLRQEDSPRGRQWVRTVFRVADTGIGMTPEFQQHLFDSFARADNAHVRATEGTGLGMAITKHIVDLMEGTIAVDSRAGEGSTFTVTLDLEKADAGHPPLPPWNILVADGSEALCRSAAAALQAMGLSADCAFSARQAVEMISQPLHTPYRAVLLDSQLDHSGAEAARLIREAAGPDAPLLLMTAYDWSGVEQEARASGVNGFLSKPLFQSTLRRGLMHYAGETDQPTREEAIDFTGRRILLAEDNDINWEIAHAILTGYGFEVDHAEDGQDCLQQFERSAPGYYDLILMDIRMPRMNGCQSALAIRALARPDAAAIPILAMTADAFNEDIQRCLQSGMNGHIAKPLDVKTLLRTIRACIR